MKLVFILVLRKFSWNSKVYVKAWILPHMWGILLLLVAWVYCCIHSAIKNSQWGTKFMHIEMIIIQLWSEMWTTANRVNWESLLLSSHKSVSSLILKLAKEYEGHKQDLRKRKTSCLVRKFSHTSLHFWNLLKSWFQTPWKSMCLCMPLSTKRYQ